MKFFSVLCFVLIFSRAASANQLSDWCEFIGTPYSEISAAMMAVSGMMIYLFWIAKEISPAFKRNYRRNQARAQTRSRARAQNSIDPVYDSSVHGFPTVTYAFGHYPPEPKIPVNSWRPLEDFLDLRPF